MSEQIDPGNLEYISHSDRVEEWIETYSDSAKDSTTGAHRRYTNKCEITAENISGKRISDIWYLESAILHTQKFQQQDTW